MSKHRFLSRIVPGRGPRRLISDNKGEAAVSFGLVLPILLLTSLGILEFALAVMDRQQAAESLRRFSRAVAVSMTASDLENVVGESATKCTYSDANVSCANGQSIETWTKLIAGFRDAQDIFPRLNSGNVVIVIEDSGLGPDDADNGTMALVTVQFVNLDYQAKVFPMYDGLIERILFPTISATYVIGG